MFDSEDIITRVTQAADEYRGGLGVRTIKGFERCAVRNDIYDSVFLKVEDSPFGTIQMHPQERYAATHLHYARNAEFMLYNVNVKTGLSLIEFMKLPTYLVENILGTLRQQANEQRREAAKSGNDLARTTEGIKEFANMKTR